MQIIFLGTNGWYDTKTGDTVSTLIKTNDYYIIFDAGNGINKVYDHCSEPKPAYLFLSHFHLDHISGLHTLVRLKCFKNLTIFGPEGIKEALNTILNDPFSIPLSALPFKTKVYALPKETPDLPFNMETRHLRHASRTLGYRITIDKKTVAYCSDTGYCENAVLLAKNSDLLITECAYKSGQIDESWPHLNPEVAAQIAKEASARQLVLIHFDAALYKTMKERKEAEKTAKKIFKNTFAAKDNLSIEI
ncbi:MBL fold metallo-hydrolase [Candidatus Desantisbacteria bacterium]|nr:MBL fold metallo-hydrolase [Candidatus Desantisbacteria bacterium]